MSWPSDRARAAPKNPPGEASEAISGGEASDQVGGDPREVDARTDVYALGALLYEVLAERAAHELKDVPIPEAIRTVREVEPARLGSVDKRLRGELELIAATAMQKDPARRYASAAELAADLRRHLADEPIQARPPSAVYQLRKLARRHRPVFFGVVIGSAALLVAAVVSTVLAFELADQRDKARRALGDSRETSTFLLDLFLGSPDERNVDRVELLRRAEKRLADQPPEDAATRAKLHEYIGHGYLKVWSQEKAAGHLEEALSIRESAGVLDADLIGATFLLAMQRIASGRVEEGEALLRRTLERRRELWGVDHAAEHPLGEMLWYISNYMPDEPEVVADKARRRALVEASGAGGLPPRAPEDLPMLFQDEFDGSTLDVRWEEELHGARGWSGSVGGSRLTVGGIESAWATERFEFSLARSLDELIGDFWVQTRIGWASPGGMETAQTLTVAFRGEGRSNVAYVAYTDGWVQHTGARVALVGPVDAPPNMASSGHGTLPLSGEAIVTVRRRGDEVTVWWDDAVFLRGRADQALAGVVLIFSTYSYSGREGTARFGSLWIDRLELRGVSAGG